MSGLIMLLYLCNVCYISFSLAMYLTERININNYASIKLLHQIALKFKFSTLNKLTQIKHKIWVVKCIFRHKKSLNKFNSKIACLILINNLLVKCCYLLILLPIIQAPLQLTVLLLQPLQLKADGIIILCTSLSFTDYQ